VCPPLPLEVVDADELLALDVAALLEDVPSVVVAPPSSPQAKSATVSSREGRQSEHSMGPGMLPRLRRVVTLYQ